MFSQTVEYALRAVVYLAGHDVASRTTEQIATGDAVARRAYLAKGQHQTWARRRLVRSQRAIGRSSRHHLATSTGRRDDPACKW